MPNTVLVKTICFGNARGMIGLMGNSDDGNEQIIIGTLKFDYVLKVEDLDLFMARVAIYCKKAAEAGVNGKIEVWYCASETDFTLKEQIISIKF